MFRQLLVPRCLVLMIKLPVHRQWFGLSEPERQGTGRISFVEWEEIRWRCPQCGSTLSVHRDRCPHCGQAW